MTAYTALSPKFRNSKNFEFAISNVGLLIRTKNRRLEISEFLKLSD